MADSRELRLDQVLVLRAAAVAGVAPREWRDFLAALHAHAQGLARDCVQALPERVGVAQGRARECHELVEAFEKSMETAGKITRR